MHVLCLYTCTWYICICRHMYLHGGQIARTLLLRLRYFRCNHQPPVPHVGCGIYIYIPIHVPCLYTYTCYMCICIHMYLHGGQIARTLLLRLRYIRCNHQPPVPHVGCALLMYTCIYLYIFIYLSIYLMDVRTNLLLLCRSLPRPLPACSSTCWVRINYVYIYVYKYVCVGVWVCVIFV